MSHRILEHWSVVSWFFCCFSVHHISLSLISCNPCQYTSLPGFAWRNKSWTEKQQKISWLYFNVVNIVNNQKSLVKSQKVKLKSHWKSFILNFICLHPKNSDGHTYFIIQSMHWTGYNLYNMCRIQQNYSDTTFSRFLSLVNFGCPTDYKFSFCCRVR